MKLTEPVAPLDRWALDPTIVHLNHGSYGGCPRVVVEAATALRARLEAAPMTFLVLDWQRELDHARERVAAFLHAPVDRLAFVPNATTGVAIALAHARLGAGDAVLTTDHGYRAVRNQLVRTGASITTVTIALPFDPAQFIDDVLAAITPRTRLAVLDHITSPTAIRLPLEALVPRLAERGVDTLVDGAHAPGQIDLDITALGARYYTGNHHKWLCAPKGSGFLVAPAETLPLVTSHGASAEYGGANRFHALHDWTGTYDPTPYLAVPAAIDAISELGGGWPAVIARNHALAIEMRRRFGGAILAPDDSIGSMVSIPIRIAGAPLAVEKALLEDGWEVPIVDTPRGALVRLSAHLYNEASQADALADKLRSLGASVA